MIYRWELWKEHALRALDDSIAHWERLRDCKTKKELDDEGVGGVACALCLQFQVNSQCTECPVHLVTGKQLCVGTPYVDAFSAYMYGSLDEFRAAAKVELGFLITVKLRVENGDVRPGEGDDDV